MPYEILIVVDDPFLRQRYAEILESTTPSDGGTYQVVSVSTVNSALGYAVRRRFDLVLVEAHLGGPIEALTRLLADRNARVRTIAIGTQAAKSRAILQRPNFPMVAPDCTATELRAIVRSLL